jgi:hypothetical protein
MLEIKDVGVDQIRSEQVIPSSQALVPVLSLD